MKVSIFYLLLLIPIGQMVFSQNTISGTVKDQTGQPLPGATVMIENTNRGTTTDFDGNFNISASKGEILVFSFVGFTTTKVTIGDDNTVKVILQEDAAQLDEVVVVGYGTQKKVNLTGSVETVTFKEEINQPVTNSGQLLYGRFSGVQLTQSSGNPGADGSNIVIRGIGTFGNSTPLIAVSYTHLRAHET